MTFEHFAGLFVLWGALSVFSIAVAFFSDNKKARPARQKLRRQWSKGVQSVSLPDTLASFDKLRTSCSKLLDSKGDSKQAEVDSKQAEGDSKQADNGRTATQSPAKFTRALLKPALQQARSSRTLLSNMTYDIDNSSSMLRAVLQQLELMQHTQKEMQAEQEEIRRSMGNGGQQQGQAGRNGQASVGDVQPVLEISREPPGK